MGEQDTCALLGDSFGIFVQVLLAVLAFSSLYYKWTREIPRRPAKVWIFDISKQAFGAMVQHFYNILYSVLLAGGMFVGSECQWYFLNILVDTTVGVLLMFLLLQLMKMWARKRGYRNLMDVGEYGGNGRHLQAAKRWFKQLLAWLTIVIVVKIFLSAITFATAKWLQEFTEMFFWPLYDYPKIELFIVMIIVPLLLNLLQFWVTDNFLKKKKKPNDQNDNGDDADDEESGNMPLSRYGRDSETSGSDISTDDTDTNTESDVSDESEEDESESSDESESEDDNEKKKLIGSESQR